MSRSQSIIVGVHDAALTEKIGWLNPARFDLLGYAEGSYPGGKPSKTGRIKIVEV